MWQLFGLFLFAAAIPIMNSCALIRLMRWTICEDNSQHNLFTRVFLDWTLNHWPTDVVVVVALSPKSLSFSFLFIRQLRPRTSLLRFCDTGGWNTAQCHSELNCVILIFKWGNRTSENFCYLFCLCSTSTGNVKITCFWKYTRLARTRGRRALDFSIGTLSVFAIKMYAQWWIKWSQCSSVYGLWSSGNSLINWF